MIKKGIGIGCMWYGCGNTGLPNPAGAFVEMHGDGTVTVLTGAADIGQGSDTVMAQIVATVMGVGAEDVVVTSADTRVTPEGGATSASRQTYISGNACKIAALDARKQLEILGSEILAVEREDIIFADRKLIDVNNENNFVALQEVLGECARRGILVMGSGFFNPDTTGLDPVDLHGDPYGTYAFATQVAEVEVNTETGEIRLLNVVAAHDVGTAINENMVEAQIEGGVVMGAGFTLLEEIELWDGKIGNPNFSDYLMLTARDIPKIYPVIVEDPEPTGPFGAKGVGEPALIPTPPAIVNAVYDAIGIRFRSLPLSQEKVLAAIKAKEAEEAEKNN